MSIPHHPQDHQPRGALNSDPLIGPPVPNKKQQDTILALESIRLYLHVWPFLIGLLALTPTLSTETDRIVAYGWPRWTLGAILIFGGIVLTGAQFTKHSRRRWAFAAGDLLLGTECLMISCMMAIASTRGHASWMSVGLWLLPGVLFQILCVLRMREK